MLRGAFVQDRLLHSFFDSRWSIKAVATTILLMSSVRVCYGGVLIPKELRDGIVLTNGALPRDVGPYLQVHSFEEPSPIPFGGNSGLQEETLVSMELAQTDSALPTSPEQVLSLGAPLPNRISAVPPALWQVEPPSGPIRHESLHAIQVPPRDGQSVFSDARNDPFASHQRANLLQPLLHRVAGVLGSVMSPGVPASGNITRGGIDQTISSFSGVVSSTGLSTEMEETPPSNRSPHAVVPSTHTLVSTIMSKLPPRFRPIMGPNQPAVQMQNETSVLNDLLLTATQLVPFPDYHDPAMEQPSAVPGQSRLHLVKAVAGVLSSGMPAKIIDQALAFVGGRNWIDKGHQESATDYSVAHVPTLGGIPAQVLASIRSNLLSRIYLFNGSAYAARTETPLDFSPLLQSSFQENQWPGQLLQSAIFSKPQHIHRLNIPYVSQETYSPLVPPSPEAPEVSLPPNIMSVHSPKNLQTERYINPLLMLVSHSGQEPVSVGSQGRPQMAREAAVASSYVMSDSHPVHLQRAPEPLMEGGNYSRGDKVQKLARSQTHDDALTVAVPRPERPPESADVTSPEPKISVVDERATGHRTSAVFRVTDQTHDEPGEGHSLKIDDVSGYQPFGKPLSGKPSDAVQDDDGFPDAASYMNHQAVTGEQLPDEDDLGDSKVLYRDGAAGNAQGGEHHEGGGDGKDLDTRSGDTSQEGAGNAELNSLQISDLRVRAMLGDGEEDDEEGWDDGTSDDGFPANPFDVGIHPPAEDLEGPHAGDERESDEDYLFPTITQLIFKFFPLPEWLTLRPDQVPAFDWKRVFKDYFPEADKLGRAINMADDVIYNEYCNRTVLEVEPSSGASFEFKGDIFFDEDLVDGYPVPDLGDAGELPIVPVEIEDEFDRCVSFYKNRTRDYIEEYKQKCDDVWDDPNSPDGNRLRPLTIDDVTTCFLKKYDVGRRWFNELFFQPWFHLVNQTSYLAQAVDTAMSEFAYSGWLFPAAYAAANFGLWRACIERKNCFEGEDCVPALPAIYGFVLNFCQRTADSMTRDPITGVPLEESFANVRVDRLPLVSKPF
ncbi:hypothetical protein BESB_078740 [Besnoitia besnoiti]|uniref:Uncharacterized protein n=1 Tax=Besnoitia besnoiti TaxID=94643 RepID=A0A2A9M587_BESBE|nr:hypothetical protein BESB_078740 [Besnoitia besnoiti]PFH33658.1 hypothetical protein BESB_078740 [Besnoitia besnoiti]